ncbi:MAG: hypothetical protein LC778_16890 [Acidobacteria bacterium]|nr:hypothetical protein [Acidobacteriota bacterium]
MSKKQCCSLYFLVFLTAFLLVNTSQAETIFKELSDDQGNIFLIRAVSPVGITADPRVLEDWEISNDSNSNIKKEKTSMKFPELPVDLSGYHIIIEPKQLSSCTATWKFLRTAPSYLGPGQFLRVDCRYAEHVDADVYPTAGDVDLILYIGPTECDNSLNGAGRLDFVGCHDLDCFNSTNVWRAKFQNASSTRSSTFVGSVNAFYINN